MIHDLKLSKKSGYRLAFVFALTASVLAGSIGCNSSQTSLGSPFGFPKTSGSEVDASALKPVSAYEAQGQWFTSWELAHRESLRTGKPLLVAFTGSDWCGPCIDLKKKVFDSSSFVTWANENVVLVELDFPKNASQDPKVADQNQQIARKFNISGYPTVLLMDDQENVIGKLGHGTDAAAWTAKAEKMLR